MSKQKQQQLVKVLNDVITNPLTPIVIKRLPLKKVVAIITKIK